MYTCPYCGNQLEGQPKFCRFCGTALAAQEPPAPMYAPPAPVYEPPAPVYAQPAYQPPVYEQPAPVYEQPVYEAPAPVYEAPAPVYEQPAQTYEQPMNEQPVPVCEQPAYDFAYPTPPVQDAAPKDKPVKKSKTGLIVGIGIALVVVVLAVLFLPKLLGGNPYIGKYDAASVTFMGMTVSGSELEAMGDFWLELKEDDKCTMSLAGEQASGTWRVDGEKISCTIEGETMTGKVKDGKLELAVAVEGVEMSFVFEKNATQKGSGSVSDEPDGDISGAETAIDTKAPAQLEGYWTLQRADSADPANAMTEADVKALRETLGTELFLVLDADGSGVGSFYSETRIAWGDGVLTMQDLGIRCMYTLEGNELTLVMDFDAGVRYVYVPGTGEAPELDMYVGTEPEDDSELDYDSEIGSDID